MVETFEQALAGELAALEGRDLRRRLRLLESAAGPEIRLGGRTFVNFASNDYLGLAGHPALKAAAREAVEEFGAGATASRLICGTLPPHTRLEKTLAEWKGTASALVFNTGYAAATGAIGALLGPKDILILDRLVHACLVDAARLSGAALRVFRHNDPAHLESHLQWAAARRAEAPGTRVLIVTESVFSMDGDLAPLREIAALKNRYEAWLMVDEAHATGLFGENRCGLAAALGLGGEIEIQMGTLGKAVGAAGGFICGSGALIEVLINKARPFIFSTAPVPAACAAAQAGIEIIRGEEGRVLAETTWRRVGELWAGLDERWRGAGRAVSPIVPLLLGAEGRALNVSSQLQERGLLVPAIRFPTVARGKARLRLTVSAAHTPQQIERVTGALNELEAI